MSNYLVAQKFFNTGFIPSSAANLRIKQGLDPQNIANACTYIPPTFHTTGQPSGTTFCNPISLYPAKQTMMTYGIPGIPNSCDCVQYIQAP